MVDFGVLDMDGFVGTESGSGVPSQDSSPEAKRKIFGSGLGKNEMPSGSFQDEWRSSKMLRTDGFSVPKTMPLHQGTSLLRSNSVLGGDSCQQDHMLSFSSLKPDATPILSKDGDLLQKSTQNITSFPSYQSTPSAYTRSSGFGTGNLNASNVHGGFNGVRGPFTPSQWMELEHQALIYKYITSNVPVPSNLLIPLKKSLYQYGFSGSSPGSYPPNSLGWGTFHLSYPGSTNDPEPGRCRRTDGKKWRCSRDAVSDQKYCERHINRGRHRSRKPVEGQTGHTATGTTNTKVVPIVTSMSTSVIAGRGASNSLTIAQQQFKNVKPGIAKSSADALFNRAQDQQDFSMMSSVLNMKPKESTFAIPKQDIPMEESSQPEFGFVSSDSLLNPSQRGLYLDSKDFDSFLNFSDQETEDQHPLCQFAEDWTNDQPDHPVISWPEELKSDWTQLSISIPMASSDFSSSSSSPIQEKFSLSPLRLSHEFDPTQMVLGVVSDLSEPSQKQANWIQASCGTSTSGPLGEVLTTGTDNVVNCKGSSGLDLLSERWDGSPQLGSSPTGVLQKATFGSLSNSSAGSSPRAEGKNNNSGGASLSDDVVGSTIVTSTPIQSL